MWLDEGPTSPLTSGFGEGDMMDHAHLVSYGLLPGTGHRWPCNCLALCLVKELPD